MNKSGVVIAGLCLIIGVLVGHTMSFSNPFAHGSSVQVCSAADYTAKGDGTCPDGTPTLTQAQLKNAHLVLLPPTGGFTGNDGVYRIYPTAGGNGVAAGNLNLTGGGADAPGYYTTVLNNTSFGASYKKGTTYDVYVYYGTLMGGDGKLIGQAQFYYGG